MAYTTKERSYKHAKGLKRDHDRHKAHKAAAPKMCLCATAVIPGKLDLRAKVSPPEDQGQCGSCWDFAIVKSLRSAHMLAGKDPGRLAFNYLLNNCSGVPEANESGCSGGDFPAALGCLNGKGPWLEEQDPYQARQSICRLGLGVAATARQWMLVGTGQKPPTFQELAGAMSMGNGNVLVVDVAAGSGNWEYYTGGIYDQNGGSQIDHMVNLVGYDLETSVDAHGNAVFNAQGQPVNGDGYLIVRNQWGTTWGENGDMRTRWGMNSIAETAMFFVVDGPAPVPPTPPVPPIPPVPKPWCKCFPFWKHAALALGLGVASAAAISIGMEIGKKIKKD